MEDLDNLFREEEERVLAEQRAEIAVADAAWEDLTQAERDAAIADWEARYPPEDDEGGGEEEEDEEDEEDED